MVCVFTQKKLRNPSTILLAFLAVSDSFVCVSLLPKFLYMYPTGNHENYLPYLPCLLFEYVFAYTYRMVRTISNWITVVLGIQRYIIVCKPFKAKRLCTVRTSIVSVLIVTIGAVLLHFMLFLGMRVEPLPVHAEGNVTAADGCVKSFSKWFENSFTDLNSAVMIYYVISGLFSRLLPCVLLIGTTAMLMRTLFRRRKLNFGQCQSGDVSTRNANRITRFVGIVMIVFVVTEIQDVVAFSIYIYEIATDQRRGVLSKEADRLWGVIDITASLIGYHLNFWIYIVMSRQFRSALAGFVCQEGHKPEVRDKQTTSTLLSDTVSKSKSTSSFLINK